MIRQVPITTTEMIRSIFELFIATPLAKDERDSGTGDFRGDFRGGIAAATGCDLGEVHASRDSRGLLEGKGVDVSRRRTKDVRPFNCRTTTSDYVFPTGERLAAVDPEDKLGFFGGEIAIGVRVLSESDLDAV